MEQTYDYGSWYWFLFITVVFILIFRAILSFTDIVEITQNWQKYRCSPAIMPFASFYGYDTGQNFNYCIEQIFRTQMGLATGPFGTILSTMIVSMMEFAKNLNSLRIMVATLVGGITKVFQEFTDRFKTFMGQTQITSLRIQMLMKRVFGVLFAVIYMGLSAITAGNNFLQTSIFKFLDNFCFAPETQIQVRGKGTIQIKDIVLGDVLEPTGTTVTSVYKFMADGQSMVQLGPIQVSTNHFVQYNGTWIESRHHPDAVLLHPWNGGSTRPLICLDTNTHTIPLGPYIFSDWDETTDADIQVMQTAESMVNTSYSTLQTQYPWPLQSALDGSLPVKRKDGSVATVNAIQVGDVLSTGLVLGTGKRTVEQVCKLPSGYLVSPSQLLWNTDKWVRAGHIYPVKELQTTLYTLVIHHSATIESTTGQMFRDMMEVHSSLLETPVKTALCV